MRLICSRNLTCAIRIQSDMGVKDRSGGQTVDWTDTFSTFAEVTASQGRESQNSNKVLATKMVRVTVRYRRGITEKMRILYGVRVFNIRSIVDLEERHQWIEMLCEEEPGT